MALADELNAWLDYDRRPGGFGAEMLQGKPPIESYLALSLKAHLDQNSGWEEAAQSLGVTTANLRRSLNGTTCPTFSTLHKVLKHLGLQFSAVPAFSPIKEAEQAVPNPMTVLNHKRVAAVIATQLGIPENEVEPDETLFTLGGDSLDVVEVVMGLEYEFGIEIPDHMLGDESAVKVKNLFAIVDKVLAKAG